MLFNTLIYAKFLAIVFLISWLLVKRRWSTLLPFLAVPLYALSYPSALAWAAGAVSSVFGAVVAWKLGRDAEPPPRGLTMASVGLSAGAVVGLDQGLNQGALRAQLATTLGTAPSALVALVGVVLAYRVVRARRVRLLFILGASYVFYAHWDWRFLPLIFGSSTVDWFLGRAIGREQNPARRKIWLVATVILNLGVLGFFKYFNFGVDTAQALLAQFGIDAPTTTLKIALPVGISFFTFESMSYVIDVYRGDLPPHKSYLEYLSFVAFFPHLVAGPIVRPRDLLPQLAGPGRFNNREGSEGLFLIALGLLKKVAIGDYLALNLVDRVFDAPWNYSSVECYAGVVGYALQIYCDFSGYTDIAIGSALLLGVRFPLNFNSPYKALDIQDFWRRWHISLSTWLRDYLYIPLGGNRKGPVRTYVNLMLTMLLGGLWHGASWTFVVWGGLHGAALAVNRFFQSRKKPQQPTIAQTCFKVCLTFNFVCLCWVFFRAESFTKAGGLLSQIAEGSTHLTNLHPSVALALGGGLLAHYVPEAWFQAAKRWFVESPALLQGALLFVAALVLKQMASADAVPFVYFQF